MHSRILASFFAVALGLAAVACGGATPDSQTASNTATTAAPLDGKAYDVTLDIPGEKTQNDTLNFAGGKFESSECSARGFPKGTAYTAKPEGDATTFQVLTRHPDGTTVEWKGKATTAGVEGTAIRTMNGKADTGTFKGTAKK